MEGASRLILLNFFVFCFEQFTKNNESPNLIMMIVVGYYSLNNCSNVFYFFLLRVTGLSLLEGYTNVIF